MAAITASISEKEAAAYFLELFSANLMPMATWRYDGTLTSVNEAFLKMVGYSWADFEEGKVNWRKLTPSGYEELDEKCIQELKREGHSTPYLKKFLRHDGSSVRVQINNILLNKADDHGLGIFLQK